MKLVFIDESGFSTNWIQDITEQPFYVVAGVCLDTQHYSKASKNLRVNVEILGIPGLNFSLGQGSEIKARDVARGVGWWADNNQKRDQLRDFMLSFPVNNAGMAFVVVVDKARHCNRYAKPEDPVVLAMALLFERIEWYLREMDSEAFCVYDHDMQRTDELHNQSMALIREGSTIRFVSEFSGEKTEITHSLDHIEVSLGASENSVGLQVADFFATFT